MRPSTWMTLIALTLLARPVLYGASEEDRARTRPSTERAELIWTTTCSAESKDREIAESLALEIASLRVKEELRKREPNLAWIPPTEYLRQRGMLHTVQNSREKQDGHYKVDVRVEMTEQDFHEILLRDREQRRGQRQFLATKLLAAAVLLLGALTGYWRLDEATRGYYTGALRLALLACLSLIGAGLWLVL